MSVFGHLKELRKRLLLALLGISVGAVGGWLLFDPIMDYITGPLLDMEDASTVINFPTIGGGLDLKMRVALWAGVLISSPWWIYQLGAFIMPGLKRREKIYTVAFGAVGVVLFAAGAASGVMMIPRAVEILQSFVPSEAFSFLQADTYVDFYLRLVLLFGVSFLLPEILVVLNFLGVLSSKAMLKGWRWAVLIAFTFAAIANPLPSPWPMIMQAMVLIFLYLLAVLISWIRERYKLYGRRLRPAKKQAGAMETARTPAWQSNSPNQSLIMGVIILAGGTAARLGGASKPDVVVGGQRLLDRALTEVSATAPGAQIAVIAPDNVTVPPGVIRVLEDPPLGGPLAGVSAGLAALRALPGYSPESFMAVLTCDAPLAPRLYPALQAAAAAPAADGGQHVGGAIPVLDTGEDQKAQYLHGVYRAAALEQLLAGNVRDTSVRSVFKQLRLATVPDLNHLGMDIDTWDDAANFEQRLENR